MKCPKCGEEHSESRILGHIWTCRHTRDLPENIREHVEILLEEYAGWHEREVAASALGHIGDPAAIPALEKALEYGFGGMSGNIDVESYVRLSAVSSIAAIAELRPDSRAVFALMGALNNDNFDVRARAAWSLGEIGEPSSIPMLTDLLKDPEFSVRQESAIALGNIRDPIAIDALCEVLLDDANVIVCGAAAYALGTIGDPAAIPDLLRASRSYRHTWPSRRGSTVAAIDAIGRIGDPTALPALYRMLVELQGLPALDGPQGQAVRNAIEEIEDAPRDPAPEDIYYDASLCAIKLKVHMSDMRLSVAAVADELDVSQTTIRRWVSGKSYPDQENCAMILDYLGLPY